jgi:methylglutaconyl-CoA hydratase
MEPLLIESEPAEGIVQLTLNRPAQRNALDAELVATLAAAIARHGQRPPTRVVLLAAAGTAFCAGADLNAMLAFGQGPIDASIADAARLANLLLAIRECPKPTIALVQGAAFGGGVGVVAACDLALASAGASFRLPEVQLGLVPAVIAPFVLEAIGLRQARRYFLSAELITAERARELGLVHEVVAADALPSAALSLAAAVARGGPAALSTCKRLIGEVGHAPPGPGSAAETARLLAELRAGAEAREGIAAALERRTPSWLR